MLFKDIDEIYSKYKFLRMNDKFNGLLQGLSPSITEETEKTEEDDSKLTNLRSKSRIPIVSYGFICIKIINSQLKVLLVRRKHTYAFVNFIIGRYHSGDTNYLDDMFQDMTSAEKELLTTQSFDELWRAVWYNPSRECVVKKKDEALNKFNSIKDIIPKLVKSRSSSSSPEWGLPKGKRDRGERNIECAKRELFEETTLSEDEYEYLDDIYPIYEQYVGTDGLLYRHVYFVGIVTTNRKMIVDSSSVHQSAEIGDIGFFSPTEVINLVKNHSEQKRIIFMKLHNILSQKYPHILRGLMQYPLPLQLVHLDLNTHDKDEFKKVAEISQLINTIDAVCATESAPYSLKGYGKYLASKLRYLLQLRMTNDDSQLQWNRRVLVVESAGNIIDNAREFVKLTKIYSGYPGSYPEEINQKNWENLGQTDQTMYQNLGYEKEDVDGGYHHP